MSIEERDFGRLEAEVEGLRNELREHKDESKKSLKEQSEKIDELLALANKGKGAYWAGMFVAGSVGSFIVIIAKWLIR